MKKISLSIVIIISLTLLILNFIYIINYNIQTHIKKGLSSTSIIVFFRPNISKTEINYIKKRIIENKLVENIVYHSSEELINYYKNNFYNLPEIISNLPEEPISNILKIYLKNPKNDNFIQTVKYLKSIQLIDDIEYGKENIEQLNNILDTFKYFYSIINMVIIISSILIITSAYTLYYHSEKDNIRIIKLLGATNTDIKKYYLFKAAFEGSLGAVISLIFILLPIITITNIYPDFSILNIKIYYPVTTIILNLFITGLIISIISAYISLNKKIP